jgi:hypothetical protein
MKVPRSRHNADLVSWFTPPPTSGYRKITAVACFRTRPAFRHNSHFGSHRCGADVGLPASRSRPSAGRAAAAAKLAALGKLFLDKPTVAQPVCVPSAHLPRPFPQHPIPDALKFTPVHVQPRPVIGRPFPRLGRQWFGKLLQSFINILVGETMRNSCDVMNRLVRAALFTTTPMNPRAALCVYKGSEG